MVTYIGHLKEFDPTISDWAKYKIQLSLFYVANRITSSEVQKLVFLNCCNITSYRLLCSLCAPETPETKDFDILLGYFDQYFPPGELVTSEKLEFYSAAKGIDEPAAEWVNRVKNLASKCGFRQGELSNVLRNKFIMGFKGPIRERLFKEKESKLSLNKVVELACTEEARYKTREEFSFFDDF